MLLAACAATAPSRGKPAETTQAAQPPAVTGLRLPGGFLANAGQYPREVAFVTQGSSGRVSVAGDGEITFELPLAPGADAQPRRWVLRERLLGAREARGAQPLAGPQLTHMQGAQVSRIASYDQVAVSTRHEGLALNLQRSAQGVEKVLRLAPGVSPDQAVFELHGSDALRIAADGRLQVRSAGQTAWFSAPVAYQDIDGRRVAVDVAYRRLGAQRYGFRVGRYDRAHALTIDPVLQATYLGGAGEEDVTSLGLGGDGSVFVAGRTCSNPFPGSASGVQNLLQGSCDAFIAKLSADLSQIQAATYLGGAGDERIDSLVVSPDGSLGVAGWTSSVQFPGTPTLNVGSRPAVFVASLEQSLGAIQGARLFLAPDFQNTLRVSLIAGASSDFYLATTVRGRPFAATQAWVSEAEGEQFYRNTWLARISADLQQVHAAAYYGGDDDDEAHELVLAGGGVVLAGLTRSSTLPGLGGGSAQALRAGFDDVFLARFSSDLGTLTNASLFGGEEGESESGPHLIAGLAGDLYLAGATRSSQLPGLAVPVNYGYSDAFVSRISADLSTVHRTLLLGGSEYDWAGALALSPALGLYVSGRASSDTLQASANGAQAVRFGSNNAFVSLLALDLSEVEQSTFIGGSSEGSTPRAAALSDSAVLIAGITSASDLPNVAGGAQPGRSGSAGDGFLLRISPDLAAIPQQPPVSVADSYTAAENVELVVGAAEGLLLNDSDPEGHPLSARVAAQPLHGAVSVNYDGSFRYAARPGYDGPDQFSYEAWDGALIGPPATVTLTVSGSNDPPYAYEFDRTVRAGQSNLLELRGEDPEFQPLHAEIEQPPQHGTLNRSSNLEFSYLPDAGFDGDDTFTFRISDGQLSSEPASARLRVRRAPDARDDSYTGLVDAPLVIPQEIGLKANDLFGYPGESFNLLSLELIEAPALGTLQLDVSQGWSGGATGGFRYTAPVGFTGTVTFRYRIMEIATGLDDTATVTLTIAASNALPLAQNDSYTLDEDQTFGVDAAHGLLANDSDPEGSLLRVTDIVPVDPARDAGSIAFNPDGSFTLYTLQNAYGHFEYRYTVRDVVGGESTALIAFDIAGSEDLPSCQSDCYVAVRGQVLDVAAERGVLANDVEPDGQPLSAELVTPPEHGSLELAGDGSFVFTPAVAAGQRCVQDGFEYRAGDGVGFSESVHVNLYICEPVAAVDDAYSVALDTALEIADPAAGLLANDLQLDFPDEYPDYYVELEEQPSHGSVQLNGDGTFTYEPAAGYSGSDSFRYRLVAQRGEQCGSAGFKQAKADGAFSRTALVVLNIGQDNSTPQAQADIYNLAEDEVFDLPPPGVLANDSDADGDSLSVAGYVGAPGGGTLTLSPQGGVHFVPPADAGGEFVYTYTVRDARGASSDGSLRFVVSAVNDAPRTRADSYALPPGGQLTVAAAQGVLGNDSDVENQPLSARLAGQAQHGSVALAADGGFSYTAAAGFDEVDSFTYVAEDGDASSAPTQVQITDRRPLATVDTYTVGSARTLHAAAAAGVLANDQDPEGRPLSATLLGSVPSQHFFTFNTDGSFDYRSPEGFRGSIALSYRLSDGRHTVGPVAFTINVVGTIQTGDDAYQVNEDQVLTVDAAHGLLANDSQIEGLALSAEGWTAPQLGQIAIQPDGSFVYTPRPDVYGTDTFRYAAVQGSERQAGEVTIQIAPVPDVPAAVDDAYQGDPGAPIQGNLFANDSNPDGGTLTAIRVSGPAHGSLVLNPNGYFTYTPAAGFSGNDSFVYRIAGTGGTFSNDAQVRLRINTRPQAVDDAYALDEDTDLSVDAAHGLLANDSDTEGDALSVSFEGSSCSDAINCWVLVDVQPDGSFSVRARNNFTGWFDIRYRVDDGASFAFATAHVVVNPVNDAPVAADDSYVTDADTTFSAVDELPWQDRPSVIANDLDVDRDALSVSVLRQPEHGTLLLNPDGRFSYVPERGFLGLVTFAYALSDGTAPPVEGNVQIAVTLPPIARPDNFRLDGGSELVVGKEQGLLYNDSDEPEYDELAAELVSAADVGTVTLQPDGSFRYQAPAGYRGPATFRYRVTDGTSYSLPAMVSIRVGPSTVPFATNDVYEVDEDQALAIPAPGALANDEDDGGVQGLTAAGYCPWDPHQGPVCPQQLRSDGSLAWPPQHVPGTHYFEYNAYDGTTFSNRATVTVHVGSSNDAPLVRDDNIVTLPGVPSAAMSPLSNDVADDGYGPLRAALVGQAAHGLVSLDASNVLIYLPDAGFHGRDLVRYRAIDSIGSSSEGAINVIVDSPPQLVVNEYTVSENGVLEVPAAAGLLAGASDADGDVLNVLAANVAVVHPFEFGAGGGFRFEPQQDFIGEVRGSFRAGDGLLETHGEFIIKVVPQQNHAPRTSSSSYQTRGATPLSVDRAHGVLLGSFDADGDAVHAVLLQTVQHGVLALNADGSLNYTPPAEFQGDDPFVFAASDGTLQSAPQTVHIRVNTPPQAQGETLTAQEDTDRLIDVAAEILANDSDPDRGPLTASTTQPANGSVAILPNGQWRYRPKPNFYGTDRWSYTISDGYAFAGPVEVVIEVAPVNDDPPTAVFDVYQLEEDSVLDVSAAFGPLANDVEHDPQILSATLLSEPARGTLQLGGDGGFRYTPQANDNGEVEFSYRAADPTGLSSDTTVRLRIRPVNDLPVALADSYVAVADRTLVVPAAQGLLANDRDVDSPLLEATVITPPQHGRVQSALDGSFSYLPDAGYLGSDEFRYQLDDGAGGLASAVVTIDVRRPNQPPTALNDSYSVAGGGVLQVAAAQGLLRNDRDPDGEALRAELALAPGHGSVDVAADGSFRYQPAAGFRGSDSFRYRVIDAGGLAATATAAITVTAVNTAPLARDDSYAVTSGVTLNISSIAGVLANDSDGDGDFLTARVLQPPAHGSLTFDYDGGFRYQPQAGYSGADSFSYVASDGSADSAAATVQLQVRAANSAPVAQADSYAAYRGLVSVVAAAEGVLANDSDANGDSLTAQLVQAPALGTLELQADGSFRYSAAEQFSGTQEFRYRAGDGQSWSEPVTVQLHIAAAPDAPVGVADRYRLRGAASLSIAAPGVLGNDQGWQSIAGTVRLVTPPAHGTLTLQPDGSFTYTAAAGRDDDVRFVYRIVSPRGPSDDVEVHLDRSLFADGFETTAGGSR
ncbi:Ig-like domain-containing protein [Tahibacter harae]|uniref:Ig-like domain-containing protein n=1 Tax=Tahibacter harae TaxID=2963937 RepID=A0ABT1QWS6_9GAMM|nr:Ig-like domain-containing protein [Tahibacter harae]MCQ4166746.1 Ig-like domain-containing protein [Tahibacter harae]